MNILFVLENYYPHIGGVETVFKNLCEGLAKLGHSINVVTHRLKGTKKNETLNNVKIHRTSCMGSRYLFSFLSTPKVIKLAKEADIIHTTTYNGALPAIIAAKARKKPSIITVHEFLGKNWKTFHGMNTLSAKIHEWLEKRIAKRGFDIFVSVSKSTEKQVLSMGVKKEKSRVVYNGIEYDFFDPKKYDGKKIRKKHNIENNFVYLGYGRPGISKGFEYLIKAVPLIKKEIKNSKLLLILSKDPAYKKRYEMMLNIIDSLKIKEEIILLDPVKREELPDYIKAADCVVVPSLTEGFGYTVAESCAMEKPVVASNSTSIPEVIWGKYVLVKPRSEEAIAKGVEMVSRSQTTNTQKKIFSWEDNIMGYLNIYNELIKSNSNEKEVQES